MKLSKQQTKILKLICRELSPPEISARLGISEKTFFNHRIALVKKTKAKTNIGLYRYAMVNGYCKMRGMVSLQTIYAMAKPDSNDLMDKGWNELIENITKKQTGK